MSSSSHLTSVYIWLELVLRDLQTYWCGHLASEFFIFKKLDIRLNKRNLDRKSEMKKKHVLILQTKLLMIFRYSKKWKWSQPKMVWTFNHFHQPLCHKFRCLNTEHFSKPEWKRKWLLKVLDYMKETWKNQNIVKHTIVIDPSALQMQTLLPSDQKSFKKMLKTVTEKGRPKKQDKCYIPILKP